MKKFVQKYRIIISAAVVIIIFLIINEIFGKYLRAYYNPLSIKNWVLSFGRLSFFVFIFLQISQVVIFFIPGEVMQAAGGYIYGTVIGTLLSILGILIGSVITFYTARIFGDRLLKKILPQKEYIKIKSIICRPKNKLIIFILYLLPGFPKDILGYVSGITCINFKEFAFISTIARVPGIVMSAYLGSNLYYRNYKTVIIISVLIFAVFIVGMLKQEKILEYFKRVQH